MKVTVAATQMSITWDIDENIKKADKERKGSCCAI